MTLIDDILTYPNLIATIALLVSFLSIIIGFLGLWLQRKHNRLSVRPIGVFENYIAKERLSISIKNAGVGPMIIKSIDSVNKQGIKKAELTEWLPLDRENLIQSCLIQSLESLENHAICIGESFPIFIYDVNTQSKEQSQQRDEIQNILKNLTIRLRYSDIYGIEQKMVIDNLEGFEGFKPTLVKNTDRS